MGLLEILRGEQPGIIKSLRNYKNPGQFGEYSIEYALTNNNLPGELVVFRNLYIPANNKTVEIDLLMIHEKGIFVFESKNYSGWIFGSADQLYWTQCLQNGTRHKFYNTIRQNDTHIYALEPLLEIPATEFISCIIFSERCSLKSVPDDTYDTIIARRPHMTKKLKEFLECAPTKYTHADIEFLANKLRPSTNVDDFEKQRHIDAIQTTCPFCGSPLVLRSGRYGPFWGCSTYPKCRFTRPQK